MDYSQIAQQLAPALEPYFPAFTVDNIGTWTPNWAGSTTAGSYTYATATGTYVRIGNIVFAYGNMRITAIGVAPVGSMWIVNLPFTASSNANILAPVQFSYLSQINYTNTMFQLTGFVRAGTTNIELFESFDNAVSAGLPAANFVNAAAEIIFGTVYQVD